ncbi:MAG: hypothetical protein H6845_02490 [Alphaproteobacteria bacterium]|nr:MAG: hypothetical protein H6845_02490 [Alphaproteobacteria bacterium]
MSQAKFVVLKFGGAALQNSETMKECLKKVKLHLRDSFPIIVVSAMGDNTSSLRKLCMNMGQANSRETDLILSTGEMISAAIFADLLNVNGLSAQSLCSWQIPIITDSNHGQASIKSIHKEAILKLADNKIIPVITGFQGITEDYTITTLGKGTSDLTAVVLAHLFDCQCYLYKEVSGIFNSDPKTASKSTQLNQISYDNMNLASLHGAKVICHQAIQYAKDHNVVINVKSAFDENDGTIVSSLRSTHILLTKQRAFLITLEPNESVNYENAFLSYDKAWCLFTDESDYHKYIKKYNKNLVDDYIKITIVHTVPIAKNEFVDLISPYSNIFSCKQYYSWVCVKESCSEIVEQKLREKFM